MVNPWVIDLKIGKLPHNPSSLAKKPHLIERNKLTPSEEYGFRMTGHEFRDKDGNQISFSKKAKVGQTIDQI